MPSDESGRVSPSHTSLPPSSGGSPPSSSQPPADLVAWGPVRDAITAIHNVELLLKSPRVGSKVLADVFPELWVGTAALRAAFGSAADGAKSDDGRRARRALVDLTLARIDELERAMRVSTSDLDTRARLSLEQVVTRVSLDLDACTELLDLAERSEHALATELSLVQLAIVSMRGKAYAGEREVGVRLAVGRDECVLCADPHVFKRLIVFGVARVAAAGGTNLAIRIACDTERASIEISPTRADEVALPTSPVRLVRRIAPTDAIFDAAARSASIDALVAGTSITLSAPRVT